MNETNGRKSVLDPSPLYDKYRVQIEVREQMDGGVPKNKDLISSWVKAKTGHDDAETQAQIESHLPDIEAAADEVSKAMWCGFKVESDEQHPMHGKQYIETRQVKAMLRECAVVLGITKQKRGSRQIVQHGFEVRGFDGGSKVYIEAKDAGAREGAIHVNTAQGPRSALKKVDFVGPGSTLEFEVWILGTAPQETRHMGEKELTAMLQLAQEDGLGANRSQGSGKFDVVAFEKYETAELPKKAESKKAA